MKTVPRETFPVLERESWLRHAFLLKIPGVDVQADRSVALSRLADLHQSAIREEGFPTQKLVTAGQVHGGEVALADANTVSPVPGCDGLITNDPGVVLGIYVADCGPIYLADPLHRAIGLLHSGKKGTAANILRNGVEAMRQAFGTEPGDLIVQLGPCIRPPHYEIDFAADIANQARLAGVGTWSDCGFCTASDPEKYYSYRRENGRTGRLLAVLGLACHGH